VTGKCQFSGVSPVTLEPFSLVASAPEGIRTPNLLIRSQKQRAFSLFQGDPRCPDKYFSPAQTVSWYPAVMRSVSPKL